MCNSNVGPLYVFSLFRCLFFVQSNETARVGDQVIIHYNLANVTANVACLCCSRKPYIYFKCFHTACVAQIISQCKKPLSNQLLANRNQFSLLLQLVAILLLLDNLYISVCVPIISDSTCDTRYCLVYSA